eukprot:Gb_40477 [translate_table: standard]
MTHEGAKWVARILARRLICSEASTYLSHQWPTIALKVMAGIVYAWAPWLEKKLKDHCMSSQTTGCSFPMPSKVVVIFVEALGSSNCIDSISQPRLNLYSRLWTRKEEKDREAFRDQQRSIYPPARGRSKPTWKFVSQDLPLSHWGQNLPRTEQTQELPEDLVPSLALKKIREKRKGRFNPFELELELILQADQAQKERAQLNDKISMLTSKVGKLDIQSTEGESTTTPEVPGDIKPYVDLLRQKARVLKETLPTSSAKEAEFSKLKMNYAMLQLRCGILEGQLQGNSQVEDDLGPTGGGFIFATEEQIQKEIEGLPNAGKSKEAQLFKLAASHSQLATKRILLDEVYQELAKVVDPIQWQNKEIALHHQYEDLILFESRVFMKRETAFQRQMRATQLTQRAKGLIRKVKNMLEDTLQFTGSERQEVEELSQNRDDSLSTSPFHTFLVAVPPPDPNLIKKAPTSTLQESTEQLLEYVGPLIDHIETRAASTPRIPLETLPPPHPSPKLTAPKGKLLPS